MGQTREEEDYGYNLFPDRNKEKRKKELNNLFTFNHKCQLMLHFAMETSKFSLSANIYQITESVIVTARVQMSMCEPQL